MSPTEVVLCHVRRRPVGRFGGTLTSTSATELGAAVVRAILEDLDLEALQIDGVVPGPVVSAGAGINPARQAGLHGGLPETVPAMTVNRVRGPGPQPVTTDAQELGQSGDIVNLAGGAMAFGNPIGTTGASLTMRLRHSMARDGLRRRFVTLSMGGGQGIALLLERDG